MRIILPQLYRLTVTTWGATDSLDSLEQVDKLNVHSRFLPA
jgi:hypothetical protein